MKDVYLLVSKKGSKLNDIYIKENGFGFRSSFSEEISQNELHYFIDKNNRRKFKVNANEKMLDAIYEREELNSEYPELKKYDRCVKAKNRPGVFYPRIFRPVISKDKFRTSIALTSDVEKNIKKAIGIYRDFRTFHIEIAISSVNQLSILKSELDSIFQFVHPSSENLNTYSHNIRNLLILICTEVEAQLKGVLKENIKVKKKIYSTKDYVKLNKILRLNEYELEFSYYPSINKVAPFKNWDSISPTKSLKWYNDYNAVKHDREDEFKRATLINVINGICALAILYVAQFGKENTFWAEKIQNSFKLTKEPKWEIDEFYLPPFKGAKWKKGKKLL